MSFSSTVLLLLMGTFSGASSTHDPDSLVTANKLRLLNAYQSENSYDPVDTEQFYYSDSSYTYSDVRPIIKNNCWVCHNEKGSAPFDLSGYTNFKKRAHVIETVIGQRIMPPWLADNHYSTFFNAPPITDHERSVVITWIRNGCRIDNDVVDSRIEAAVQFKEPSLELEFPTRHEVKSGVDSYQCFRYDLDLKESKYLIGVEFLSDNAEVIHHRTLFVDTANLLGQSENCWDCIQDNILESAFPIQAFARGMRPFVLNEKLGIKLNPGNRLLLQTHYGFEGAGRLESTTLRLHFSDSVVDEVKLELLNKLDILYPANSVMVEHLTFEITDSTSLLGLIPHSHYLARQMECFAVTSDSKKIPLLRINDWNYTWQGQYLFEVPVILPPGTTIYYFEVVDNSDRNPYQPNDPIRDVMYDTSSTDEMLTLVLLKKPYRPGDENMEVGHFLDFVD